MKHLAILGAGGHGRVVADAAILAGWNTISFFDDVVPVGSRTLDWTVVGNTEELVKELTTFDGVIVAVGNNKKRIEKSHLLGKYGANLISVVDPSAQVSRHSSIGIGTVVLSNAVIEAGVSIGNCCIINTAATISHDCQISGGVHVSPGAHLSGEIVVGRFTWIGTGASLRNNIIIGENVTVGVGSVVVKNIPDDAVVYGNPAVLRIQED